MVLDVEKELEALRGRFAIVNLRGREEGWGISLLNKLGNGHGCVGKTLEELFVEVKKVVK